MKNILDKVSNLFSKFLAVGAGFSMFAIFMIIFINATRRYAVGKSFEWGEQLPVFCAIYGIMFGMAWAYLNDQHVRFTILVDFIPEKVANRLSMVVDIVMIGTGMLFTYSGYLFAMRRGGIEASGLINTAKAFKELTGLDSMILIGQMYPYQFAMAIGGVLLVIAALLRFLNRISESFEDKIMELN